VKILLLAIISHFLVTFGDRLPYSAIWGACYGALNRLTAWGCVLLTDCYAGF